MSKMTIPMAVFGGLAFLLLSLPTTVGAEIPGQKGVWCHRGLATLEGFWFIDAEVLHISIHGYELKREVMIYRESGKTALYIRKKSDAKTFRILDRKSLKMSNGDQCYLARSLAAISGSLQNHIDKAKEENEI